MFRVRYSKNNIANIDDLWESLTQYSSLSTTTLKMNQVYVNNITGNNAYFNNLGFSGASFVNISGTNASFVNISGTNASFVNESVINLTGTNVFTSNLSGNNANFRDSISISSSSGFFAIDNIQTDNIEYEDTIPTPIAIQGGQNTLNPGSVYNGSMYRLYKGCLYNNIIFRIATTSVGQSISIGIYQCNGGLAGSSTNTAKLITSVSGDVSSANTTISLPCVGTNKLSPGIIYIIWGKVNTGNALTCEVWPTMSLQGLNQNILSNTIPINFTVNGTPGTLPSTLNPISDLISTVANTGLICRLTN